jgi:hypothetical protein
MTEETSLAQTQNDAASEVSTLNQVTAHAADQAPADNTNSNSTDTTQATSSGPTGNDAQAGNGETGGVNEFVDDYEAQRLRYLSGDSTPANPAPQQEQALAEGNEARMPNLRIRPVDEHDLSLLNDWKENGAGKPLHEFILERLRPTQTEAEPVLDLDVVPPADYQPKDSFISQDELDAEIKQLRKLRLEAKREFSTDNEVFYEAEIERLQGYRKAFGRAVEQAARIESVQSHEIWQADLMRAKALLPDAGIPGTLLESKAAEIRQRWVNENHPLAYRADSAVAIYAQAASELRIAPVQTASSAAPNTTFTPPVSSIHRPPANIIASGDARANPARQEPITADNYEEMKARYMASR